MAVAVTKESLVASATRQGIPVLEGTSAEGVAKGGYVLGGAPEENPDVVLIGTGSELQLAFAAAERRAASGPGERRRQSAPSPGMT